jgi:hypothetical protein
MTSKDTIVKIVLLALAALALLTLLAFDLLNIRSKNREAAQLLSETEELNRGDVAAQSIRILKDANQEEIEIFESLTSPGVVAVIESLEKAGRALGLETEIVSVEDVSGESKKIRIVIEGEGSFSGAYSLVKAVESLPQKVMLEGATLSKGASEWKARVEFSLYSFD